MEVTAITENWWQKIEETESHQHYISMPYNVYGVLNIFSFAIPSIRVVSTPQIDYRDSYYSIWYYMESCYDFKFSVFQTISFSFQSTNSLLTLGFGFVLGVLAHSCVCVYISLFCSNYIVSISLLSIIFLALSPSGWFFRGTNCPLMLASHSLSTCWCVSVSRDGSSPTLLLYMKKRETTHPFLGSIKNMDLLLFP